MARAFAALAAFAILFAACTSEPPRSGPSEDVGHAAELARDASSVLLRLAVYDYALAGTLIGDRTYVVTPERYAAVVREATAAVATFTAAALAATVNAAGPLRERVVVLADRLIEVVRDANAYADGGDPASFGRVVSGVARGWGELRALVEALLIPDDDLIAVMERGGAFVVTVRTERAYALTLGPFSSRAEAEAAAGTSGDFEQIGATAPYAVRVGTFADRAAADARLAALTARGLTGSVLEEELYIFSRSGPSPDPELWREPERVFDTWTNARRVAVGSDAAWVATGHDDGTIAIFTGDGVLRSLPQFNAGVAHMAFSADGRFLMGGGQTLATFVLPPGTAVGTQVRLPAPATQVLYVPSANAFAAVSKGPTGDASGGPGGIAGRAPDGVPLGPPFPMITPASGAALAATDAGELYVATSTRGGSDVEVFRVGHERGVRGVVRVAGEIRALAVSGSGLVGAVMTDEGVFRFGPHDADPSATVKRIADPVRDLAFDAAGTLYLLTKDRLSARGLDGAEIWSAPLIDGRRLVIAARVLVVDGPERVVAFDGGPGGETLGVGGAVRDLAASPDGRRVAALVDGDRAVIFKLP